MDDSELNLQLLSRYLQRLGHANSIAFNSAVGALHWLLDRTVDTVEGSVTLLTDLAMPSMDGTTLVQLWRQIEAARPHLDPARIIIISASHLKVCPPGVDAVLEKPLTLEQLKRQLGEKR